jgi:hypothetical protein
MFTGGIRTDAMDPRQKCSKLRVIWFLHKAKHGMYISYKA